VGLFKFKKMFQPNILKDALIGLVGFNQNNKAGYDRIDDDLVASESGMIVNSSAHPLINSENITNLSDGFIDADYSAWIGTINYKKGEVTKEAAKYYQALRDNINKQPSSNSADWKETNKTSQYLRSKYRDAVVNLFNSLFAQKKLWESAKTLLTDTALYDGVGNLNKKTENTGRFVGFAIRPNYKDVIVNISWLGMQFDTANPSFKLYVYHSSQREALLQLTIPYSKAISFEWKQLAQLISLSFNSANYNDAGVFYVGYYQSEIVGKAIWKEQGFKSTNCTSCNGLSADYYNKWSKFFDIQAMYCDSPYLDVDKNIFDETKIINIDNQNWGLNFRITATCDVTDLIVRNRQVFANALKAQITHDLLSDMAFSTRTNQLKEIVSQKAAYALNGSREDISGSYKKHLEKQIEAVSFDLSNVSPLCLPCNKAKTGVYTKSVFGE
jgi:hypothetical protein